MAWAHGVVVSEEKYCPGYYLIIIRWADLVVGGWWGAYHILIWPQTSPTPCCIIFLVATKSSTILLILIYTIIGNGGQSIVCLQMHDPIDLKQLYLIHYFEFGLWGGRRLKIYLLSWSFCVLNLWLFKYLLVFC